MGSNRAIVFIALHSRNALRARRDRNGVATRADVARGGRALRARRLVGTTGVQGTARPTGTLAFGLFAGDIENDAKTRFAAHHSLVRLGRFF